MNAPASPWSDSKVSQLWSAKGDERCSPPRSDDYKDWSLMQLKREITQRQLKTNPRRRNKDAFVRVLLQNDQEQTQTQTETQIQNILQTKQQISEGSVVFARTATSELQNIYAKSGDQQQRIYGTDAGKPQRQQEQPQRQQEQPQQQIYTDVGVTQAAPLTTPTFTPSVTTSAPVQMKSSIPVATDAVSAPEAEVATSQSFQVIKRLKVGKAKREADEAERASNATALEMATTSHQGGKGATECLRRKLSIQAARLEIESRRLDLESKREQRNSELHAVQLALAQEQLHQAKITTQKMKTEWIVEQMIQKKRLSDAGISQKESANLGF